MFRGLPFQWALVFPRLSPPTRQRVVADVHDQGGGGQPLERQVNVRIAGSREADRVAPSARAKGANRAPMARALEPPERQRELFGVRQIKAKLHFHRSFLLLSSTTGNATSSTTLQAEAISDCQFPILGKLRMVIVLAKSARLVRCGPRSLRSLRFLPRQGAECLSAWCTAAFGDKPAKPVGLFALGLSGQVCGIGGSLLHFEELTRRDGVRGHHLGGEQHDQFGFRLVAATDAQDAA